MRDREHPRRNNEGLRSAEAFMISWAWKKRLRRGSRLSRGRGIDADLVLRAVLVLELHDAVDEGVDGVVRAQTDVVAGMPLGSALADDDVAGDHALATVLLHAAVLRIRVAAVARGADALLMCHWKPRSTEGNVVDTDFGETLPVTALARVVLPALLLEDDNLLAAAVTDDLAGDLGATQRRDAGLDVLSVVAEEDVVELDGGSRIADERRDLIGAARLDTELLAAGANDGVRHGCRCVVSP